MQTSRQNFEFFSRHISVRVWQQRLVQVLILQQLMQLVPLNLKCSQNRHQIVNIRAADDEDRHSAAPVEVCAPPPARGIYPLPISDIPVAGRGKGAFHLSDQDVLRPNDAGG